MTRWAWRKQADRLGVSAYSDLECCTRYDAFKKAPIVRVAAGWNDMLGCTPSGIWAGVETHSGSTSEGNEALSHAASIRGGPCLMRVRASATMLSGDHIASTHQVTPASAQSRTLVRACSGVVRRAAAASS